MGSLLADTPIPSTNAQDNDDEDHKPLLVPTHENTNIPDSPTHDTKQPQHSESEQQDELSLKQSSQDYSYKQVSIGPTPNFDFTAPDTDYTDPNQYVEGKPPPKGLTWEQSDSLAVLYRPTFSPTRRVGRKEKGSGVVGQPLAGERLDNFELSAVPKTNAETSKTNNERREGGKKKGSGVAGQQLAGKELDNFKLQAFPL
eukprot:g29044.t1